MMSDFGIQNIQLQRFVFRNPTSYLMFILEINKRIFILKKLNFKKTPITNTFI